MARDFIRIDPGLSTQKYASDLIRAIDKLKDVKEDWKRIADLVSHMNDGSNFTDIETFFGLPAGTGSGANGIVTGVVNALDASAVNTVTGGRVG